MACGIVELPETIQVKSLPAALVGASLLILAATGLSAEEEPIYLEVTKILASDAGFGDQFGESLAIDGDTLVVGGDDIGIGGAYVYERNHGGSNAWEEVVKLQPPGLVPDDNFGLLVAIQGDLIAASAAMRETVGNVFLFERNAGGPGNWGQTARLLAPEGNESGRLFAGPAIDGDTLLIGATGDEDGGGFGAGAVYVYERDETHPDGWRPIQKIIGPIAGFFLGEVLDIDGDTFVAGSPSDDEPLSQAGSASIFERGPDGLWEVRKKLVAPQPPEALDRFGQDAAIEGETIVIGANGIDMNTGAAYVYGRDIGGPGNWGLEQTLSTLDAGIGNNLGRSVDIGGDRILVGAYLSNAETENAGAMHVFERDAGGTWIELVRLDASDKDDTDWFGDQVGISGGTLVAGALDDDDGGSGAGSAYVFQAVASPEVAISGTCPGELTLELSGATPSGPVLMAYSESQGQTIVSSGQCGDVEIDLESPQFLARFLADSEGDRSLVRMAPAGACGLYLQVVDQVTCGVGSVTQIP